MGKEEDTARTHWVHHEEFLVLANDPVIPFPCLLLLRVPLLQLSRTLKGDPIHTLELVTFAITKPVCARHLNGLNCFDLYTEEQLRGISGKKKQSKRPKPRPYLARGVPGKSQ